MATLSGNSAHCRRPGRGDARAATPVTADALGIAGLIARRALPPAMTVTGLLMAASAQGATITVDENCSLQDALTSASSNVPEGGCVAGENYAEDTIILPENGLFTGPDFPDTYNPSAALVHIIGDDGSLTIEGNGSTFRRYSAQPPFRIMRVRPSSDPGAAPFRLTLRDMTITGGLSNGGSGIDAFRGSLTLENVTIESNTADGVNAFTGGGGGGGIALAYGTLTVTDSTITGNVATGEENGEGQGYRGGLGGGIDAFNANVFIFNSRITNNSIPSGSGGGIFAGNLFLLEEDFFQGTLSIENSVISGNAAEDGAGIVAVGHDVVEIRDSTISANSAFSYEGQGGSDGAMSVGADEKLRIMNSTISGNYSQSESGVVELSGASAYPNEFTHNTVTGNQAASGVAVRYAEAIFRANIISGNDGNDFHISSGTVTSGGGNIIGTGDNAAFNQPGDQINVIEPGLGPLENNGGDQLTHEPLPSSVAVDNVVGDCGNPFLDQRGLPRPLDGDEDGNAACDAGAVEFAPINPIIVDPGASNRVSDSRCSLVEAIDNAENGQDNTDCLIGDINGPDIISLPPSETRTYGIAFGVANGINALPNITTPITIEGNGSTVEGRDDADFRLIHVAETGNLTINDMMLTGGAPFGSPAGDNVASDGGAVLNHGTLRLNMVTVSGNSARRDGGGINNRGDLVVTDSTISGNTADRNGGGLYNFASTASLSNSTVSGNSSGQGAGGILSAYATLTVDQSTVSGNTGVSAGGIDNFNASLRLFNSTVATNASAAGGLRNRNGATADLRNNLIAKQTSGPNCANAGAGSIGLGGTNLADDASCAGFSVDADTGTLLGVLADNGGPTFTHALMPGHPGVDSVPTSGTGACPGPNADQRGMLRPLDGDNNGSQACDVGALEYFNPDSDDDDDQIPNGYETDNDLDPFDSTGDNGADGDPDGDGLINLAEFQNGAAANNPDSEGDGLGDAIDLDPANDTNACVADGNGDADFNMTAMSGLVTQCAAPNAIRVLAHPDAIIEAGSELQLYSLTVSFQQGASVPQNASVRTIIGNPVPGEVPPAP